MPQIQMLQPGYSFGAEFGKGLGQGASEGIQSRLTALHDQKRNTTAATNLVQQLGLPPDKSEAFTSALSQFKPEDQPKAIETLMTAKILTDYLGGSQGGGLGGQPGAGVGAPQPGGEKPIPPIGVLKGFSEQQGKRFEREDKKVDKFLEGAEAEAKGLPERRIAVNSAKQAVQSGQLSPFGGDWLADVLNVPGLKSASGAQLATAGKQNLIGSLTQAGGSRPNQFIEQQITNAFARAGQTEAANLASLTTIEAKLDLDEKRDQLVNEIADQQIAQYGRVLPSISRDVDKAIKPYYKQRMDELAYDLQRNIEKDMNPRMLEQIKEVAKGTPLTLEKAKILLDKVNGDEKKAMQLAENLGYTIPDQAIYAR